MSDLLTMMWKESKDLLFQRDWKARILPVFLVGILGVYLPLQFGLQWLELSPIAIFVILWIPFFVIISFIGDAIAGERERHTLETLLASRISDRAILLGKVIVTVGYAWGMALVSLVLGLVLVNLFHGYRELDVLSSFRPVPGSSGFESAVQCPGSRCRSADLAAIGNGAAGTANLGRWNVGADIRRGFCLASIARELHLIVELFPGCAYCS